MFAQKPTTGFNTVSTHKSEPASGYCHELYWIRTYRVARASRLIMLVVAR